MKRLRQFSAVLIGGLMLSSCASIINEKYLTGKEKQAQTGLVVVAYGITGQWRNSRNVEVYFHSLDQKIKGSVNNPSDSAPRYLLSGERVPTPIRADFQIDPENPVGGFHVLRLPAGEYEFYHFSATNSEPRPDAIIRASFESRRPFSAKFTVKPETITYVGRLVFLYSPEVRVGFKISDKSSQDIAALKKQHEQFKATAVEVAVPSMGS